MDPTAVLSPEIADLAYAVGLLTKTGDTLTFNDDWFDHPGPAVSGMLADDGRRRALEDFVDAVNGDSPAVDAGGITLLKLFAARDLDIPDPPDLVVQLSVDDTADQYVQVGIAVSYGMTDPLVTRTDLVVPLYRTGKFQPGTQTRYPVPEHFALLAGARARLASCLTLTESTEPDEFSLREVRVAIDVSLAGADPSLEVSLLGLRLPGATATTDIVLGGPDSSIEDSLLGLVTGVVRAGVATISGVEQQRVLGLLALAGFGDDPALPRLDADELARHGVAALRDWFTQTLTDPGRKAAWLAALRDVTGGTIGGGVNGDELTLAIAGTPVSVGFSLGATLAPAGGLTLTPRVSLRLTETIGTGAQAVRLAATAVADLFRIDTGPVDGTGTTISGLPHVDLALTAAGANATTPLVGGALQIGSADLGLAIDAGVVTPAIRLHDVHPPGLPSIAMVDLSSVDAVVATVGQVASGLASDALDAFPAGAHLKALLGLSATGASGTIDANHLLVDPLATLAAWWQTLVTTHAADVPAVLGHLRALVAQDGLATALDGTGTADAPWALPLIGSVQLPVWVADGHLHLGVDLDFRTDTLGLGCTRVDTRVRVDLADLDLAGRHATLASGVELAVSARQRGVTETTIDLGEVQLACQAVTLTARWTPTGGFTVVPGAPGLVARLADGTTIPITLPTGADWTGIVLDDVQTLVGLLPVAQPLGLLRTVTDVLGWTAGNAEIAAHRLDLAALVAAPETELRRWAAALLANSDALDGLVEQLATLLTGSSAGVRGATAGRGTPDDPWQISLVPDGPALSLALYPAGPRLAPTDVGDPLRAWRPGLPGLPPAGLVQALQDEGRAAADVRPMARGREALAAGLDTLALRITDTDVLVAAPVTPTAGVTVDVNPGADHTAWASLSTADALGAAPAAGTVVVRVRVGTQDASWPAGRVVDLTAPGLSPESFPLPVAAIGEWFITLAGRADASLGLSDPSGVQGQAARLTRIVQALSAAGPVVLIAEDAAGIAARLSADTVTGVTQLVTLGTPWGPVGFTSATDGSSGDALRLLRALLPDVDPAEPDDPDLALGRAIVIGLTDTARQGELTAALPTVAVRAGLRVLARFGGLPRASVDRAFTAIVAAGLSTRAVARAAASVSPPTAATVGVLLPLRTGATSGVTVEGQVTARLARIDLATGSIQTATGASASLQVRDAAGWLVGGPGSTGTAGAPALELRSAEFTVDERGARLVLHEVAALGRFRPRLEVRPGEVTGAVETQALLPEARAALNAVSQRLRTATTDATAATLHQLLVDLGLSEPAGIVPDAVVHLLHEPTDAVNAALTAHAPTLATALAAFAPGTTVTGSRVTLALPGGSVTLDLASQTASLTAAGSGALPWQVALTGVGKAAIDGSFALGAAGVNAALVRFDLRPFRVTLDRNRTDGSTISARVWPAPEVAALQQFASAALPAEVLRLLFEGLRGIESAEAVLTSLASALGLLGPAQPDGRRLVIAPVALLEDPSGWLRRHVLTGSGGLDADAAIDLLEALKPFVGIADTTRGRWGVADGVVVTVTSAPGGPRLGISVDPTAWLTAVGRPPFAAGVSLGLTVPSDGAPAVDVDLFAGVSTTTTDHRQAVHVIVDGTGLRVLLRTAAGTDVALFPNPAGIGAVLSAATDLLLPMALKALAELTGDPTRTEVAALVKACGRGLGLVETTAPTTFLPDRLHQLADHPDTWLEAHLGSLVVEAVTALDPLLAHLPGTPSAQATGGVLTLTVRGLSVTVDPAPLSVSASGSLAGIPGLGRASGSFTVDATGVSAFELGIGPAPIDFGPVIRPFVRVGRAPAGVWRADLGLALDGDAPTTNGHQELFARWSETAGLDVVARTRTSGSDQDASSTTQPERIALFAADAVLELLGTYLISLADVSSLLDTTIGTSTIRAIVQGSVLDPADDHAMLPRPVSSLPQSLFSLIPNVVGALPGLPLGPVTLGAFRDGDIYGLRLGLTDPAGRLDLNPGSDVVVSLVVDADWIDPPETGGVEVSIVRVTGAAGALSAAPAPGISANGVGVRIGKGSGPLLDAGLRLDAVAVHLYGALAPAGPGAVAVSGGVNLELEGLAVPLGGGGGNNAIAQGVMADAGSAGTPPRPKFSPALAIQAHHGTPGVAVSLRAGSGDGPWFLAIQRAFGPVYIEQVGLGTGYKTGVSPRQLERISVLLDGSVSLFGITASVDKLRLTYQVTRPFFDFSSWEVDLDGFAIAANISGLTLAGALLKADLAAPLVGVEYLGMLKIGFNGYGVDLFGGYANPDDGNGRFASFFAFGALHAPLGGVPAFFITGIGLGFGINRALTAPTMETIGSNPFLAAMRATGPAPDPRQLMEQLRTTVQPARGQFWIAAGISFTSFVLITGEVVITVAFGDGLEIVLLGMARVALPTAAAALVSIELALLARFSTKEGSFLIQAQLTENSWLLSPAVRLTGGFAMATWWKGPNAGQFVVTIGGYHPIFHHDGYPVVPRVGLRWQPIDNVLIVGENYFALCSEAIMAGTSFEASAHFGPAHASVSFGADGIVFFDPFWFEISAWAEIRAGITIDLWFATITVELSLGAKLTVTGPPVHVRGVFEICGFEVPFEFGENPSKNERALTAAQFTDKYLRASADAQPITMTVLRGGLLAGKKGDGKPDKVPDGSSDHPLLVTPEFELTIISTAPAPSKALKAGATSKAVNQSRPLLGVAPMKSATLDASLVVELRRVDAGSVSLAKVQTSARPDKAFPIGIWGEPMNPDAKTVPTGDTVDASDGFTLSTVLPDPTGAPQIDYHQVEIPLNGKAGRKPLPFVTATAQTNLQVTQTTPLTQQAATVQALDDGTLDRRFALAATALDIGDYGMLGVAALRGDRSAPPRFGSLADDLVKAPGPVSTRTQATTVDRSRPEKLRPAVAVASVVTSAAALAASANRPRTTVSVTKGLLPRTIPTLADVRRTQPLAAASLIVTPVVTGVSKAGTMLSRGMVPSTRLATQPTALVANARPNAAGQTHLLSLTQSLPNGIRLPEGQLTVIGVGGPHPNPDQLTVSGGPTRVVAMAAGGLVLSDQTVEQAELSLPIETDRVVIAALGAVSSDRLAGWYGGLSLPLAGWNTALAAGCRVAYDGSSVEANRQRHDGGWVSTSVVSRADLVRTSFTSPVRAIAVAIDDPAGASAAANVEIKLRGATVATGPDGSPRPPVLVASGLRTVLVYDVRPDDTAGGEVTLEVDGSRFGELAGVLGGAGSVDDLVKMIARDGMDALAGPPLPAGPGSRTVTLTTDDPQTSTPKKRGPR